MYFKKFCEQQSFTFCALFTSVYFNLFTNLPTTKYQMSKNKRPTYKTGFKVREGDFRKRFNFKKHNKPYDESEEFEEIEENDHDHDHMNDHNNENHHPDHHHHHHPPPPSSHHH